MICGSCVTHPLCWLGGSFGGSDFWNPDKLLSGFPRFAKHGLPDTPQKSNIDTKKGIFKGSYLFQTIILGIQPLVFRGVGLPT